MIGLKVIEVLATFVESFLGIWINTEVLGNGADKKKITVAALVSTCLCWGLNQYKLFSVAITVIGAICIILASYWFCRSKIFDSLILTACYMVVLYIIDFLVISVFGLVWSEEQFAQFVTTEISLNRIFLLISSKLLLALIVYVVGKKWLRKIELPVRKLWISVALSVFLV